MLQFGAENSRRAWHVIPAQETDHFADHNERPSRI